MRFIIVIASIHLLTNKTKHSNDNNYNNNKKKPTNDRQHSHCDTSDISYACAIQHTLTLNSIQWRSGTKNKAFTQTHMLLSCKENLTLSDFEDERGKGTTILYHIEQTHIFTSNGVSLKRTHNGQRISMYRYLHTLLLHFACDCICASE